MNRDEIDELMKENGIVVVGEAVYSLVQLVIEQEREACAEWLRDNYQDYKNIADICEAIRARGER